MIRRFARRHSITLAIIISCTSFGEAYGGSSSVPVSKTSSGESSRHIDQDVYKVLVIEDHRDAHNPLLLRALNSSSVRLVKRALLAIGRIGDAAHLPHLIPKLEDKRRVIRQYAAFAIGLIKDPESRTILENRLLEERRADVRNHLYQALGRLQQPESLSFFRAAVDRETDVEALPGLSMGLCYLFLGDENGQWSVPERIFEFLYDQIHASPAQAVSAAWALARFKGDISRLNLDKLLDASEKVSSDRARAIGLKALARFKADAVRHHLTHVLSTAGAPGVKIEAAQGLIGQQADREAISALVRAVQSGPNMVRVAALNALITFAPLDVTTLETLKGFYNQAPSPWVRGKTFLAIAASLQGDSLAMFVRENLATTDDPYELRDMFTVLPRLGPDGIERLRGYAVDESLLIAGGALGVLTELKKDQIDGATKALILNQFKRHDPAITSLIVATIEKNKWIEDLPSLIEIAQEQWTLEEYGVLDALMSAFATFADPSTLPLVEKNLNHPMRTVVLQAVKAYANIVGHAPQTRIPLNNRVEEATPSLEAINTGLRSDVTLVTTKGSVTIRMIPEAPLTVAKFVNWAQTSFYKGLAFHRVVPDWVVQGGDPRGDGEGGSGIIRDEVSVVSHQPYTVGIATAGKDTGSTQIFFNLAPNLRLDGSYTVFGKVVKGAEIIDRLEIGDRILESRVSQLSKRRAKPTVAGLGPSSLP